jgi:F-type H+-transporting ATPase subunit delta
MTERTASARYARALLDVATHESADLDAIARQLDDFIAFLKQQPTLERVLLNPAIPAPRKRNAMAEIAKIGGQAPIVAKLLVLLAERDRLGLLHQLAAAYHDLLADRQQVVRAEVTSAEPLPQDRLEAIQRQLANTTGKRVSMTTTVNKDILGGMIARVGGTVYDASVATQLKKIRDRLTA